MLSCFNLQFGGELVIDLLVSVAKEYPHALQYPFRMVQEDFASRFGDKGENKFFGQLSELLRNTTLERFIQALDNLTNPEVRRFLLLFSASSPSFCPLFQLKFKDFLGNISVATPAVILLSVVGAGSIFNEFDCTGTT
jgi:hypothetical protein